MTDSLLFYAKELSVQMGGGLALGSGLNFFFPAHSKDRVMKSPAKTLFEVLLQSLLAGASSLFFINFLRGHGFDPQTTTIGVAPFWIYFIGAQTKMTRKTQSLIDYAVAKVESIDPSLASEAASVQKSIASSV